MMPRLRRTAILLFLIVLAVAGCTSTPASTGPDPITVGIPRVDKWPGRGALVHDDSLRQKVSSLLSTWSPPGQGKVDRSWLLWAGRVDGTVLAVAAVEPVNVLQAWQVELSGPGIDQLSVTSSSVYPHAPSIEDVRAVRSPCCEWRYLVSAKVTGLAVTGGPALAVKDSLSDRASFVRCSPGGIEVTHDSTNTGYVELGTSLALGQDPPANAALLDVLRGLNTCGGPLPAGVIDIYAAARHALTIPVAGQGQLIELNWATTTKSRRISLAWRPDGDAAPTFSSLSVDSADRLGVFPLDLPSGRVIALTWLATDASRHLVLPPGVTPLVESPGVAVLSPPGTPFDAKLMAGDQVDATKTIS
jgi:hypothetical protein